MLFPMKVEPLLTMVACTRLPFFNVIEKHSSWVNNMKSIPFKHAFIQLVLFNRAVCWDLFTFSNNSMFLSFAHLVETKNLLPFCLFCLMSNTVRTERKFITRIIPFIYIVLFKAPQPLVSDIGGIPCVGGNVWMTSFSDFGDVVRTNWSVGSETHALNWISGGDITTFLKSSTDNDYIVIRFFILHHRWHFLLQLRLEYEVRAKLKTFTCSDPFIHKEGGQCPSSSSSSLISCINNK